MKNLKVIFLSMLVLFMTLSMASCSDNDNDNDERNAAFHELIGTWEYNYPVAGITMSWRYTFTKDCKYVFSVGDSDMETGLFIIAENNEIHLVPDESYYGESTLIFDGGYLYDELGYKYKKIK